MRKMKYLKWVFILALPIAAVALLSARNPKDVVAQTGTGCEGCHDDSIAKMQSGKHVGLSCDACHGNPAAHLAAPNDAMQFPKVPFNKEVCAACHSDQYNSFLIVAGGKTFYGGSDLYDPALPNDPPPPKGWSKTSDLPYWNVLIDGHPFVLETYEDRPMAVNQIEHQETIRPGSESCMACHGTKLAFYMGIQYRDANGNVKAEQMKPDGAGGFLPRQVLIKSGTYLPPAPSNPQYPMGGTWNNSPSTPGTGHLIYDGTSYKEPTHGVWEEAVTVTFIPNGTTISTFIDALDVSKPYQVKTLVTLPTPVTVTVPNVGNLGAPLHQITFDTVSSYPESGADINGVTGCTVIDTNCPNSLGVANVARNWAYAAMEAMAFDGLDYQFDPLVTNPDTGFYETHFTGSGSNWPSIQSGQLCNQCHDPMSAKPRIIKKSLIEAIAVRGVNPYSPTGSQVHTFEAASRQDQIIAQCAQCHSEYVGGYSANDSRDRDYFPWAKPNDLENLYWSLFNYMQDWSHGAPIAPWQSTDANARGFTPYGQRYPINAKLVKVQHPEAEEFMNSPMYNAGATCTDCHSARITKADGTRYTSHWFTSPLKIMNGYSGSTYKGENIPGDPISMAPQNPCARCHVTDTIAQSQQRIKSQQDQFYFLQERTQIALVNGLKFIKSQQDLGIDQSANIQTYQRASMRWEYYTQAENSMSFHNNPEATTEVSNARIWVDAFVPWPLTPVKVRITNAGSDNLTLTFFDQANDEIGFIIERATALEGPYLPAANVLTPNGANTGDVQWTDTGLSSGTTYFYRVAAYGAGSPGSSTYGPSIYSIWAKGTTLGTALPAPTNLVATAISSSQINLTWMDNSSNETGFRIERARDANFTNGLTVFEAAAGVTNFSDTGLTPNTTYYYRVFAFNAGGSSSPSNSDSETTLAAPPAAPSNLLVKSVGQTSVTLNWKDNSGDELGFYLERSNDSGKTWTRIATLGPNTTSFTNTGLARRTTFLYRIQAYNLSGASNYSNVVSAKTK